MSLFDFRGPSSSIFARFILITCPQRVTIRQFSLFHLVLDCRSGLCDATMFWHRTFHVIILFFLSCRIFFLVVPFVRLFSNVVHSLLCTVFATSYEFVNVVILTATSLFICSHCRFEHHILCLDLSKIMGVAHAWLHFLVMLLYQLLCQLAYSLFCLARRIDFESSSWSVPCFYLYILFSWY